MPDVPSAATLRALCKSLEETIGGEVRFDAAYRAMHANDASIYEILPAGVVVPKDRQDVLDTVRLCREHGVSITARGGGTSQAGQAIGEGVIVDFSRHMNRLLGFDPAARTVTVEPGIVLDELNARLAPNKLQLPLDLSTANRATLGGMIANNSAGTRSVVYGKTLDYVLGLTTILADGSVVEMGRVDGDALAAKLEQEDREGACYRTTLRLAAEHEAEIRQRYPPIQRRVGGYNLDEFLPGRPCNLARLLVGSEGTLGLVLAATLRLVQPPACRVLAVAHFGELLSALEATPAILEHGPSAVELLDRFILDTTAGQPQYSHQRALLRGDSEAVLFVELAGNDRPKLEERLEALAQALKRGGLCHHVYRTADPAEQAALWQLRRAALGLSMSQRGDAKAISFIEDAAVPVPSLHRYVRRLQEILRSHGVAAGLYAHASVGLLHVRPVIDLKGADGVAKLESIASQVADLVLELGGALSGEHGDGLVRSPFQRRIFGDELYSAFRQLKRTFDPDGLFNPGKIVDPPPLTSNLRFGPEYATPEIETSFDFSDFGGAVRAAEQCSGVGACRKARGGTMCPSFRATRDEADSTRGRANALRMAMTGKLGADRLADPTLLPILDLCLECKACGRECPTGVDIARLKAETLHRHRQRHGGTLRSWSLAHLASAARLLSPIAGLTNLVSASAVGRWLGDATLAIDGRRTAPPLARQTFLDWWRRRTEPAIEPAVALFADTFTTYFEPEHGRAAVEIAERLGRAVVVPPRSCCGRPLISKGYLDEAAKQARKTTAALLPLAERGVPIVFLEPSCYSAVRDDLPKLLRGRERTEAERVASLSLTFEEWAVAGLAATRLRPRSHDGALLLHAHCHQKALTGTRPTVDLLNLVPGAKVVDLDGGCCGMAGAFGYEREHYELSRRVGDLALLPAVRARAPSSVVIAPGFSCRHQIAHFTGVEASSTAVFMHQLLTPPEPA